VLKIPRGVYIRTEEHLKKLRGYIPWNKGKTGVYSDETRRRMGESKKGKPLSKERKEEISKSSTGRTHTEEAREKIRQSKLGERNPMYGKCGELSPRYKVKVSDITRKRMSDSAKKIGKREEIKLQRSVCKRGEKSSNWKGGTSFIPYCFKFDRKRKKAVIDFFGGLCICSGERQYHKKLSVHHIDHDKEQGCNGKPFNLVPMNDSHHAKEGHAQDEYKAYINKTLREGFKWGIWNEQEYMEKVMYDE
jgi:hypothetical protein